MYNYFHTNVRLNQYQYVIFIDSAWLSDDDHPLVRRISTLIEDVTGLNMDTAEALQVLKFYISRCHCS